MVVFKAIGDLAGGLARGFSLMVTDRQTLVSERYVPSPKKR